MKLSTRRALTGALLCLPLAACVCAAYLLPFCMAVWRSLHRGMGRQFAGLQNYLDLFCNGAFRLAAGNTRLFWAAALPLNLLLGLLLALLCRRAAARWAQAALFLPAMLPAACVAALVGTAFSPAFAGGQGRGSAAVLLGVFLWKSTGYTVLLLAATLCAIPRELAEEAASAGASGWQVFWRVQLPLLLPALGVSLVAAFLNSFKIFREAYLLAGTHPANGMYSLQHFLYNNFANMNYPRLAAASVLLIGVIGTLCELVWVGLKKRGWLPE